MKAIFIGSIYPEEDQVVLKQLGSGIDNASHTFQSALLKGFENYYDEVRVITCPSISSYPRCKKISFKAKEYRFPFAKNIAGIATGFINLPLIKMISKYRRVKKALKAELDKLEDETVIYIYATHSPFMKAVCNVKHPKAKTCLIVPDLPEFMSGNKNRLYRFAKRIDKHLIDSCVEQLDSFVLLSPYMKERLPIGDKPWIQMEGIFQDRPIKETIKKEDYKTILYTGNIGKRYGIIELLDAFSQIKDDDYRLWIRGNGETLAEVQERAKTDHRIVYFEQMSKEELLKLQRKATLLVNPVSPKQEFTRYFFPSKTMEYLASGTPTMMFNLDCLPKEYHEHLYFFENDTPESMSQRIQEVCSKSSDELKSFGEEASQFILNQKNAASQTGRVVEMIKRNL